MLRPVLAVSLLLGLACGGAGLPQAGQQVSGGAPMQPAPPTNYGQPGLGGQPTGGYWIQGPVQGDDGAIVWTDSYGHVTGMYAEGYLAFGINGQLAVARDPYGGWYGVQNQQLYPIAGMPPDLMAWPGVQTMLPGGYTLPAAAQRPASRGRGGGGYDPSIQAMQNVNDMVNQTNMTIIDNMSAPSTDYYSQDSQYLGSW